MPANTYLSRITCRTLSYTFPHWYRVVSCCWSVFPNGYQHDSQMFSPMLWVALLLSGTFSLMYMVFSLHVCLCITVFTPSAYIHNSPETEVIRSCEPLCGFWEWNLGHLPKQQVILAPDLSINNHLMHEFTWSPSYLSLSMSVTMVRFGIFF